MSIGWQLLSWARGKQNEEQDAHRAIAAEQTWRVAEPFPGVVPQDFVPIAMDDATANIYSFAQAASYGGGYGLQWMGYPYLAELAQRPEYRRLSETIAREMTRKWIEFEASGDEDKTDKIKCIEAEFKRLHVQKHFRRCAELDGYFGRAQIYLDTGDTDNRDELRMPLRARKSKISIGKLKRLVSVEPVWTYPNAYESIDPLKPDFYKPKSWFVQGKQVHTSRMLTFVSREVPDLLKPAYAFSGLSMSQIAQPYVENWLRTRQSVSDLLKSFSVSGIKTNMAGALGAGTTDPSAMFARAQLFNLIKDNRNLLLLDKDTEEFFNVSTPLGTLDKLQAQSQEQQASVSGIPLIVLLGITPSGLNASSEGELRQFYAWINATQEQLFTDPLSHLLEIVQLSLFGEVDPEIGFKYVELWQLDEVAKAGKQKTESETDVAYINAGVLSPLEVRRRIASEQDSAYPGLDVEDVPEPPQQPGNPEDETDPFNEPDEEGGGAGGGGSAVVPFPQQQIGQDVHPDDEIDPYDLERYREWLEDDDEAEDKAWSEGDHPRGQPENVGEFASSGGGGRAAARKPEAAAKPQQGGAKAGMVAREPGAAVPEHIAKLRVPPAWTDVRYSPDPNASLMVVGKDAKGRPQAIYSAAHSARQAAVKFARIKELMDKFNAVAAQNDAARGSDDMRTRDAADCMALVMKMGIRPGSETDTGAQVQAYGATTLQGRHVQRTAKGVVLSFTGKKGVALNLPVDDPGIAKMLTQRAKAAGADGQLFPAVSDKALLDHAHALDGGGFKTKDFRTRLGTQTAADMVASQSAPSNAKEYKKAVMTVAKAVSQKLGNTPAIALQSYIAPEVFASWRIDE